MINYYDILGVKPTVSTRDLRRAYIRQSKLWHPDGFDQSSNVGGWSRANKRFQQLSEAYTCLRDAEMRQTHDSALGYYWKGPNREDDGAGTRGSEGSGGVAQKAYVRSKKPFNTILKSTPLSTDEYLRTFMVSPGGFWRNYLKSLSWDNRIALCLLALMILYVLFSVFFAVV